MVPRRFWIAVLAVSLPLIAGACIDRSSTPTGPRESLSLAPPNPLACSFSTIRSLIGGGDDDENTGEFRDRTQRSAARSFASAMQTAGQYTAGAKANGFSIMALIATAKKQDKAKDAATGSSLTNQLILCMFDPSSGPDNFPSTFPVNFVPALDRNQPGAYEVRGATNDANPVLTYPGPTGTFARLSALTPTTTSWSGVLTETTLIYGNPIAGISGPDPDQYEWKTIRPGVTFADAQGAPGLLVALCNPTAGNSNDLESETEVGFLPFVGTLPACTATFAQLETSWGPRDLVRALGRFGSDLVRPDPLFASTALVTTSIGGTAKGGKSIFSRKTLDPSVASVTLQFVTQPSNTKVNTPVSPAVRVQATYQGSPVAGVVITLIGVTNNGTPTQVLCGTVQPLTPCKATTQLGGIATFDPLTITKPGALTLVVTDASISGRAGISFGTGTRSIKINVKPK